jgi:hypothetical protein
MMAAPIRNESPKCQLCYRTAHPKAAASIALGAPRNAYASTIDLPSRPIVSMLSEVAERMAAIIAKSIRRSAAHAALLLAFKRKRRPPAVNVTPLLADRSRESRT